MEDPGHMKTPTHRVGVGRPGCERQRTNTLPALRPKGTVLYRSGFSSRKVVEGRIFLLLGRRSGSYSGRRIVIRERIGVVGTLKVPVGLYSSFLAHFAYSALVFQF